MAAPAAAMSDTQLVEQSKIFVVSKECGHWRTRATGLAGRGGGDPAPGICGMAVCSESAGVRRLRAAAADLVFQCGMSLELPFETRCLAALIVQRFACTSPFDVFDPDISECLRGAARRRGVGERSGSATSLLSALAWHV